MGAPEPRRVVESIPAYRAGRAAERDEHKLSSNENPYPPLPGVIESAARELARINRYPDAGMSRLYEALSATVGRPTECFAAGTGSVAVLFALLQAYCGPGDEVVYPWRSFEAYPIAVDLTGARGVRVPLRPDATHDLSAMTAAITERTTVVLVCTPNNPTGPVVTADDLEDFLTVVPDDVLVVIDEAYLEFVRDPEAALGIDALAGHDNVVVLRTFSKAYGLAGLRVGYAIAAAPVAAAIRKATPPFSVTDVAQAAAVASLDARDELGLRVEAIVAERDALADALRAQGWEVPQTQANFVWLPLGDQALAFAEQAWPLSVRPFDGEGVRVSIGSPDANAAFLAAAARWRAERT